MFRDTGCSTQNPEGTPPNTLQILSDRASGTHDHSEYAVALAFDGGGAAALPGLGVAHALELLGVEPVVGSQHAVSISAGAFGALAVSSGLGAAIAEKMLGMSKKDRPFQPAQFFRGRGPLVDLDRIGTFLHSFDLTSLPNDVFYVAHGTCGETGPEVNLVDVATSEEPATTIAASMRMPWLSGGLERTAEIIDPWFALSTSHLAANQPGITHVLRIAATTSAECIPNPRTLRFALSDLERRFGAQPELRPFAQQQADHINHQLNNGWAQRENNGAIVRVDTIYPWQMSLRYGTASTITTNPNLVRNSMAAGFNATLETFSPYANGAVNKEKLDELWKKVSPRPRTRQPIKNMAALIGARTILEEYGLRLLVARAGAQRQSN